MRTQPQHSDETLLRRRRLSYTWAALVLAWAFIRTALVWAAVGDYGLNPWIYLAIDLVSATVSAISTPRMVLSFIDEHYVQAVGWAVIALVAFIIPDVYIFLGTRELPTGLIVIICVVIGVTLLASVIGVLRKIHKGRAGRVATVVVQ